MQYSIFQMEINSEAESVMQDPLHRGGRVLFSWPGRDGVQLAGEFLQFSSGPREVRYIFYIKKIALRFRSPGFSFFLILSLLSLFTHTHTSFLSFQKEVSVFHLFNLWVVVHLLN